MTTSVSKNFHDLTARREARPGLFTEALIGAVLLFSAALFGAVHAWTTAVVEVALFSLLFVHCALRIFHDGRVDAPRGPVVMSIAAFIAFSAVQAAPLPGAVIGIVSPGAHEMHRAADEALLQAGLGPGVGFNVISLGPHATRTEVMRLLAYSCMYVLVFSVAGQAGSRIRFMAMLSLIGLVIAFFGIVQHLAWNGRVYWVKELVHGGTPFGPFINRNNFAAYMNMAIPLSIGLSLMGLDRGRRLFFAFSAALMTLALFMSLSRGSVFAFLVSASLYLFLMSRLHGPRGAVSAAVALGLPAMLYFFYIGAEPLLERFSRLSDSGGYPAELRGRVWLAVLSIIRDYPIVGTGFGTFDSVFWGYRPAEVAAMWWQDAHNDYLQIAAETGLAGALIAFFFVFTLLGGAVRQMKKGGDHGVAAVSLLCASIGFLLSLLTTSSMRVPAVMLFFFAVAALISRGEANG